MSEEEKQFWKERYFLDHYGNCQLENCECRDSGQQWLGIDCEHWKPLGARSFEDLMALKRGSR